MLRILECNLEAPFLIITKELVLVLIKHDIKLIPNRGLCVLWSNDSRFNLVHYTPICELKCG